MVSDLRHFLDMPDDAPAPARRLAAQLAMIVRAATAGDTGAGWVSALPCPRRPGRRPCIGHIALNRTDIPASIRWQCTHCGDEGIVSGWLSSAYDLRQLRAQPVVEKTHHVVISPETAAALRSLLVLDLPGERLVWRARITGGHILLTATAAEFEDLLGYIAAEANHEPNKRRQKQLDAAFHALLAATQDLPDD
ncbi:MAG: hypothetical protein ACKVWR_03205 [Acidimicrobiales bacterium]